MEWNWGLSFPFGKSGEELEGCDWLTPVLLFGMLILGLKDQRLSMGTLPTTPTYIS